MVCPVVELSATTLGPPTATTTPGTPASEARIGPEVMQNSQIEVPVAGFSARTPPRQLVPRIVVLPPATKSVLPFQTAGERLPPPDCGPSLFTATALSQMGPAAMFVRSKAKKMPSLLAIPTIARVVPPIVALKSVGAEPKSPSG